MTRWRRPPETVTRPCPSCGRDRPLFQAVAGPDRCNKCLRFAGLGGENDPPGSMRAPGGALRGEPGAHQ